jgi:hypothetical protein
LRGPAGLLARAMPGQSLPQLHALHQPTPVFNTQRSYSGHRDHSRASDGACTGRSIVCFTDAQPTAIALARNVHKQRVRGNHEDGRRQGCRRGDGRRTALFRSTPFYLSTVLDPLLSDSCDRIGLAVLRVRQAEAEAEVVERLPTPGGMSSPSVFGSPPPVGSGTGLAMPTDERLPQQKRRLVRAATSTISTLRAQSASAKTRTVLLPRMPLSLARCDASAWTICRSRNVM